MDLDRASDLNVHSSDSGSSHGGGDTKSSGWEFHTDTHRIVRGRVSKLDLFLVSLSPKARNWTGCIQKNHDRCMILPSTLNTSQARIIPSIPIPDRPRGSYTTLSTHKLRMTEEDLRCPGTVRPKTDGKRIFKSNHSRFFLLRLPRTSTSGRFP